MHWRRLKWLDTLGAEELEGSRRSATSRIQALDEQYGVDGRLTPPPTQHPMPYLPAPADQPLDNSTACRHRFIRASLTD